MKHNFIKLMLPMLLCIVSLITSAHDFEMDGIYYKITSREDLTVAVTCSGGSSYSGQVSIPETVVYNEKTYLVTSIADSAFCECNRLTSITIPKSVTSIGKEAFISCYYLISVHISDIVAWCKISFDSWYSNPLCIAQHLYLGEEEIKDLIIPNSVTSIASYAFAGCSGLISVTIPNSVTSIGTNAFTSCYGLTSVVIPNSVTSIGKFAFNDCPSLTSITIPNSVTNIGDWAFTFCGLTSVAIPNSVTSIGEGAFYLCHSLTSVSIGSGVTNIGSQAFSFCMELTDVYCWAEDVPKDLNGGNCTAAFDNSNIRLATLHVPIVSIDDYKAVEPWMNFKEIVALTYGKCDKPNIIMAGNKFMYECDTPDATFRSRLTANVDEQYEGSEVVLKADTITYTLTVIASAPCYEDSDPVTMTFTIDRNDVNMDGTIDVADIATFIDKMAGK